MCGQVSELLSRELVPGDVVELHVGDRVPADIRVIALKTATLRAEQASLTGESVAVLKAVGAVSEEGCELQAKVTYLASCLCLQQALHIASDYTSHHMMKWVATLFMFGLQTCMCILAFS